MPPSPADSPHLLLLPSPPRPLTRPTLSAAYQTPITATLTKLNLIASSSSQPSSPSPSPTKLVIAVAAPVLTPGYAPPQVRWGYAQSLLAGLYTILAIICADNDIDAALGDGAGSLDATFVLVDFVADKTYQRNYDGTFTEANGTVIRDLPAFAYTVHPWATVFHPSSEPGYQVLRDFLAYSEGRQSFLQNQLVEVQDGISMSTEARNAEVGPAVAPFKCVCLGGTFDHLHPGHKLLLQAAALLLAVPKTGEKSELIIGIAADELLKNKKFSEELQGWDQRARAAISVLATTLENSTQASPPTTSPRENELHATLRDGAVVVRCVAISDPFGPPIHEENVFAIVVSGETRAGGKAINDKRQEKGWAPLEVFEIDVLDTREVDDNMAQATVEDFSTKISSTAIRQQRASKRAAA
ncbi:hypothetical protein B0I35DRAFT_423927 [Stachybotrys elegans]|uniref:Cytidyltransferase-like domain-containing protein n=1 Tax=Stachybotrys elegans TaxID=80388 RepID=A0A8K0SXK2_9HYPO|nr:hypothetical protein B0I35DRAFT_423927 [Stachybotrys elegans]